MRTFNANLEGYMTLCTGMVLILRVIEPVRNGRKILLKIKIFMWLVSHNVILPKDNLVERKWKGSTTCAFCSENENSQHLFFDCPTAKYIWSLIAYSLGADCRPNYLSQFWLWIQRSLPQAPQSACSWIGCGVLGHLAN
jgi:hypothetical protein